MNNPRVVDAVGVIESIRQHRQVAFAGDARDRAGFASGGYTSAPDNFRSEEFAEAVRMFVRASRRMRAYVVYKDIEDAEELLDRSRRPFSRNNKD